MGKYILSLSFGNYLKADGGVDKAITEYQNIFNKNGINYIHISPIVPNGKLKKLFKKIEVYTLLVNGDYKGFFDTNDLYGYINGLNREDNRCVGIHIHHTKKFSVSFLKTIIESLRVPVYFFIHDYFSICDHPNLLQNNLRFCGNTKKIDSNCDNCIYGESVTKHIHDTVSILQNSKELYIISPSEIAIDIWKKTYFEYFENAIYLVVRHQKLIGQNEVYPVVEDRLKIGFIGRYSDNKGKKQWEEVVRVVENKKLPYELFYLGFSDIPKNNVKKIDVRVDAKNPNKMLEKMKESGINCAFMWSICPETYSYAYFEAFAANLYIITNQDSGNIAYLVQSNGNGCVYKSIEEFISDLQYGDKLLKQVKNYIATREPGPKEFGENNEIADLYGKNTYSCKKFVKGKKTNFLLKKTMEFFYLKKNGRLNKKL